MKQALYLLTDHGIDGSSPESITFASLDEKERDDFKENSPNKNWLTAVDRVHDLDKVAKSAWRKLDGLQRLAFLQTSCPMWDKDYDVWK